MKYAIRIRALWRESSVGLEGWIGARLVDGRLVALCSAEKWNLGRDDSLRRGWKHNEKHFRQGKTIYMDVSEKDLRRDGLGKGKLRLTGTPH